MPPEPKLSKIRVKSEDADDAMWEETAARLRADTSDETPVAAPQDAPDQNATPDLADTEASDVTPTHVAAASVGPATPTPRDLRKARRRAKRLGMVVTDDMDAYNKLMAQGVDLNAKTSVLDMVAPTNQNMVTGNQVAPVPVHTGEENALVQVQPDVMALPAQTNPEQQASIDDATRQAEIAKIQRGLVKRRRRRLALLLLKLFFFVGLPTFLVGHYYYETAAEMYETKSEFVIQKSESTGGAGIGGLFSGTGFATSQDSITVQGYLTSREAMRRLDADQDFIAHFQNDDIDTIQRLDPDASEEDAYKVYKKRVKVGFDPTEGIIRLDVVAATAEASERFNQALISYAEERVDNLSQRVREDQMAGALASYQRAEDDMKTAQDRVLELQQLRGVLSAEVEISAQMSLISSMELERETKALDLAEIMANPRPNRTRARILEADIARLDTRIAELRTAMTQSTDTSTSLARITGELRVAEADLANRQLMLQTALQQMENARIEANRQVRYLSMGVAPLASDTATYPRRMENTILGFVIFLSIYILVSLTVSILREQVSV